MVSSNRMLIAGKVVNDSHKFLHVRSLDFIHTLFVHHVANAIIPTTVVLPKPMNTLVLTQVVDNQQIYDVGIPIEIELQVYDNPSLVFRIEDQSQPGEYVYIPVDGGCGV